MSAVHPLFNLKKRVKVVGYAPTPHKFCPLTHYGDLFDGKAANAVAFSAHKGL